MKRTAASRVLAVLRRHVAQSRGPFSGASSRRAAWTDSQGYERFGQQGVSPPRGRYTTWMTYLTGASVAAGGVVYVRSFQEVPYTHRNRAILFVSPAMETALGEQTFSQICQQAAAEGRLLPPSHPHVHLVRHVGQRIAQVAVDGEGGGYNAHMQGLRWEYVVIDSPEVNAMVAPGGKVVVYSGLLRLMAHEAELAAVLAHETAHVLARHTAERITKLRTSEFLNTLLYLFTGIAVPVGLVVVGMFLPYTRLQESEADAIGVRLMSRACYDPQYNVSMLAKLLSHEERQEARMPGAMVLPAVLRTHPLTEDRVVKIKAALPDAYRFYEGAGCAHVLGQMLRAAASVGDTFL